MFDDGEVELLGQDAQASWDVVVVAHDVWVQDGYWRKAESRTAKSRKSCFGKEWQRT